MKRQFLRIGWLIAACVSAEALGYVHDALIRNFALCALVGVVAGLARSGR